MDYTTFLKARYFICDIIETILNFLFKIILSFIYFIRLIFYVIFSIVSYVSGITFLLGLYFIITVIIEIINGINLQNTTHYGFALLFFAVPIISGILREIVKP